MHASKSILMLIAALSAGTLALPSAMAPKLQAREDLVGLIAGYNNGQCNGDPVPGVTAGDGTTVFAKPIFNGSKDQCLTFNTPAEFLGITFGSFDTIVIYQDAHCTSRVSRTIKITDHGVGMSSDHSINLCVQNLIMVGGTPPVGSFQFAVSDHPDANANSGVARA